MVPFSFPQPLLKSRVMNKYISSSATLGVWVPWAWGWELDVFILSCFPAFLILIPVPVFPSFPSVFKNRGWFMAARRKAKLPNEPNFKMPFPQLNIGDFPFSPVFETCKKQVKTCQFCAIFMLFRVVYEAVIGQKQLFYAGGHPSLKNGVPGADHRLVSIIDRHAG
jgi:hypothetical protein